MTKLKGYHRLALVLGLFLASSAQTASAGAIAMQLTVGSTVIDILKGGTYDTSDPFNDNIITVNTNQLNTDLAAAGHGNLKFGGFQVTSNNPGLSNPDGAELFTTGQASVTSGSVSFTLVSYQTDFFIPSGDGTMRSYDGGGFSNNAATDNTTFTSYFSADNSGTVGTGLASPTLSFLKPGGGSYSDEAALTPLGTISGPYALVHQITGTLSAGGTLGFSGTTKILATPVVPEPASVVSMMSALPIAFGLIRRYRRGVKNAK